MDLDVAPQVRGGTLQNALETILQGQALLAALVPHGVLRLRSTTPKQTNTTQRWNVSLELGGGVSVPTRIEFSRRRGDLPASSGIPDAALLSRHRLLPFAAQFYDATQMAAQKIAALASPSRYAARDLFDLHHLLRTVCVTPAEIAPHVRPEQMAQAVEKIRLFTHRDFTGQVVPYLPDTLAAHYRDPDAFARLRDDVAEALTAVRP